MIFENAFYVLQVDVEKTKAFYDACDEYGCDCPNFIAAADALPERAKAYLKSLGADLRKLVNVNRLFVKNGRACYDCTIRLAGRILEDNSQNGERFKDRAAFDLEDARTGGIVMHVWDQERFFYPCQGFPKPCMEGEFFLELPWVLDEPPEV